MRQMLVTGRYSDGSARDLTGFCDILCAESTGIVNIGNGGLLRPKPRARRCWSFRLPNDGATVPVAVTRSSTNLSRSASGTIYRRSMCAGCNAGACHGIPSGRGGFKLSLRGYDPAAGLPRIDSLGLGPSHQPVRCRGEPDPQEGAGTGRSRRGPRLLSANPVPQQIVRSLADRGLRDDPAERAGIGKGRSSPHNRIQIRAALAATGRAGPFQRWQRTRRHSVDRLQQQRREALPPLMPNGAGRTQADG